MKIRQLLPIVFAALAYGLFSGSANAQDTTGYTYFVHGAPGRDLASTFNPVFPLDVLFNNKDCILQGWAFGDIKGPFSYPAGTYDVKVSVANTAAPCSNTPFFDTALFVLQGQSSFAVAAISPANTFIGYLFTPDLTPLTPGNGRVLVANASTVPSITAGFGPAALDFIAAGSSQTAASAPAGSYAGAIYMAGSTTPIFGPVTESVGSQTVSAFFVVGSATSGSLQILSKAIPNVF